MGRVRFPLVSDHLSFQPEDPADLWNSSWTISFRDRPQETIGSLRLTGVDTPGEAGIYVELEPAYRDQGYGTEIFSYIARFCFRFRHVREVCAVCARDNDRCVHALEKAGFVLRDRREGMEHYSMKRARSAWTGLYTFIGLMAGMIIGIVISNLWIGTAIGVLAGWTLGMVLDRKEKYDTAA